MLSYPWVGTRCKKDYKVNKKKKLCVSTKIPAPKPIPVPLPVGDWYPHVEGTRCKKGYKVNKTLKRCVSTKSPVPIPVPVYVPPPPGPKPPEPIQQIIQIARTGNKCPATFSYNKTTKFCEKCPDGTRKVGRTCVLLPSDDVDSAKEDVPVVMPKPPPVNGEPLKDFINRLEDTGKKVKDPIYRNGRYMAFVYIYLIKKYAASCSIFNDPFLLQQNSAAINYNINAKSLTFPSNLAEQMRECVLRGSELIFITLYMYAKKGAHVNLIIYRPFKKVVERYEPHGQETGWGDSVYSEFDLNKQLKELFEQRVQPIMKEYTPVYRTPYEVCPMSKNGFQGIENLLPENKKEAGFCQMWTMFLMETILLNPTLNTQTIIEDCIQIGKNDPNYFKNLIRGYLQQISREIKLYLKQIKVDIGTDEAHHALAYMNIEELVNETMAETKKQNKPLPPLGVAPDALSLDDVKELEKEAGKLNATVLKQYFNFIHLNRITQGLGSGKVKDQKELLLKTMLSRALKWGTLMDNIYNTYFTELSAFQIKKQDYFIRFNYYPSPNVDLSSAPMKNRMQLLAEVKAKYPNWHTFNDLIGRAWAAPPVKFGVKDKEKVDKDVKKLKPKQVSEFLYLLEYTLVPKNTTGPLFDKKLENERVITLTKKLKDKNLHVVNLQHWISMF